MTYDKSNATEFAKHETQRAVYDAEFFDYHETPRNDGAGLMYWAGIALCVGMVAASIWLCVQAIDTASSYGPNCPGMDYSWLGKCEVTQ